MIDFIKKIFAKWFIKEEAMVLTEEDIEPVVEKLTHCGGHTRFKKSCALCQAVIK